MAKQTVSESIVATLADAGVTQIWGVPGGALNSFNDALSKEKRIEWIGVRHEEVGAFAVGAQAQLTGKLGVCAGTVGPGAVHLLNGLYDAAMAHCPILAITGQVPISVLGTKSFQEVDLDYLLRDCTVYHQTIYSPSQVPNLTQIAVQRALAESMPTAITIPGDIGPKPAAGGALQHKIFESRQESVPAEEHLQEAIDLINAGGKVTVFAGIGVEHARDEVLELADKLKAPVGCSLRGKDILEAENPSYVGQVGLIGNPACEHALQSCDVLLLLGTDFPYIPWYPKGKKVVQIDSSAARLGRRTHVDVGLIGHCHSTIRALLPKLDARTDNHHLEAATGRYAKWRAVQDSHATIGAHTGVIDKIEQKIDNPQGLIRPESVAATLSELSDDDAVFTADVGMCCVWASRFLKMKRGQRLLGSFNHGSMANAMPQALGAQALDRKRQVISLSGDGGFTMLMGDFITAVAYDLPIKVIVFNNGRLGMVKMEEEVEGIPEVAVELKNPDFSAVAKACGATGYRVEKPADLRDTLKRALETDGPVLVDVVTNPNEISMPPHYTVDEAWGFSIAKVKEMLRSHGKEE